MIAQQQVEGQFHSPAATMPGQSPSSGKTDAFSHLRQPTPSFRIVGPSGRNLVLRMRTAELIRQVGGLAKAATLCRVGKSTLARYTSNNPEDAECFVPVDVIHDLERHAGEPLVTVELCQLAGGAFVSHPKVPPSREELLAQLAAQAKEQSDLTTAICAAVADGEVTREEAALALLEQEEVLRVGAAMRARLLQIVEETK